MPDFDSAGVRIHYELAGPDAGDPIVLVHGFASTYALNWVLSRWEKALTDEGWLVIGLDCRGHGQSEKPHRHLGKQFLEKRFPSIVARCRELGFDPNN